MSIVRFWTISLRLYPSPLTRPSSGGFLNKFNFFTCRSFASSLFYLGFSNCLSPPFFLKKFLIRSLLIFSRLIYLKTLLAIVVNLCIFFALLSYEGQEIPNTACCYLAPHCYYRFQSFIHLIKFILFSLFLDNSCNNCIYMILAINIIYPPHPPPEKLSGHCSFFLSDLFQLSGQLTFFFI